MDEIKHDSETIWFTKYKERNGNLVFYENNYILTLIKKKDCVHGVLNYKEDDQITKLTTIVCPKGASEGIGNTDGDVLYKARFNHDMVTVEVIKKVRVNILNWMNS